MLTNFLIFYTLFSILFLGICRRFNILMDKKIEKHKKEHAELLTEPDISGNQV